MRRNLRPGLAWLSVADLWPLTVLLGIFAFLNTHPIRPHDFWWHMAVGREILTTGHIPAVDTFSFTAAGRPYPAYAVFWLPEVALYLLYRAGGLASVVFAHALTVTAAYGLTLLLARRISGSSRVAALATLFAAALGIHDWNVRPQAATFFLAPLMLWAIHEYRRRPRLRLLALFPLAAALWANCHGSFPLGILIPGLWLIGELWPGNSRDGERPCPVPRPSPSGEGGGRGVRQPPDAARGEEASRWKGAGLALLGALMACMLNPRGPGIFSYLLGMSVHPVIQGMVPEWAPPTFSTPVGATFLLGLLATAALLALSPIRPTSLELLLFLAFGALGLRTVRGAVWFGLTLSPVWARHLAAVGARWFSRPDRPAMPATLLGMLLAAAALTTLPWFKPYLHLPPPKAGLLSAETPVAATEFLLRERPPGPLFHAMPFGSYLIWAAQPDYPVFVDSRIELYPMEVWLDYLTISAAGCGWEERLQRYGVRTLMLSLREQPALVAAIRASPRWRVVYEDEVALLAVRVEE